ncbi:MAG TPA: glycosyltransferase family 4 protein [Flavobacterium sp.]|uniref:glycosyltransferase family 4 protein n=1 Tax=unclassified Flavobacterium TaxID=196869 RepID=UPI0025B99738|nr:MULTISPECIES: glycosyltransferase family 4 protein [unclassified Flavobacterium]HRE79337.1 glycosyltransferase family 4 protein [Flavobacterium sp.]
MCAKKLTIVSDTAIFHSNNSYYGFGPVVREIEFVEHLFDQITWIGFDRQDRIGDLSMQKIQSNKIKFILLKNVGGKGLFSFLKILTQYPFMFFVIYRQIQKSDIIHTRAPSHPALIAILISYFFNKNKIWWNKYAGDWGQIEAPSSYRFQRNILKKATFSNVTINGFWSNQPKHCFSFENPCLTKNDIENGKVIAKNKTFSSPYTFCFVGRFDNVKGVSILLDALKRIPPQMIEKIHLIGDGHKLNVYKEQAKELVDKAVFHGFLQKNELHKFMEESHFLLLPSKAEGFPKVVAEAACYGTIPIVSNVGSIPHYINVNNGFLWKINDKNSSYEQVLENALKSDKTELQNKSMEVLKLAELFTFENYLRKLETYILK